MNERIQELAVKAKLMAEEDINRQISYNAELKAFANKFAELIIRDFIATCDRLADEAANDNNDAFDGLIGSGWGNGWISCAERLTEIVATDYNINHESFMLHDPKKPFFLSKE
jgi:hypothetical protein